MSAHLNCTHPATKSARALCRKMARNFPGIESKALTAAQVMPAEEPIEAVEVDNKEEYRRLCALIEENRNAKKGQVVTRENWREFRDLDVEIIILNNSPEGQAEYVGRITAWGEKRFSYRSVFTRTLNHASAPLVVSVVAVKDQD